MRPVSAPKAISGRADERAGGQALGERFIRLATPPEMGRKGSSAPQPSATRAQARSEAPLVFFSTPFMTQLISQAIRGLDRPEFDVIPEAGIDSYRESAERGARYYYGLLDPFDVSY